MDIKIVGISFWMVFLPIALFGQLDSSVFKQIFNGKVFSKDQKMNTQALSRVYRDTLDLNPSDSSFSLSWYLASAISCSKRGYLDKADSYWVDIQKNFLANLPLDIRGLVHLEWAAHLVRKNDLEQADSIYQNIQINDLSNKELLARYYEQLGFFQYLVSKYDLANYSFGLANDLWNSLDQDQHMWFLDYLNHYALYQTSQGQYHQADSTFNRAMEHSQSLSFVSITLADVYSNYGSLKSRIGDDGSAIYWFNRAKSIYQNKQLNLDLATLNNNLALAYDQLDSIDLAIELYQQAIDIYKNQLGVQNLSYITILNNLAGLQDYQEHYDEAKENYWECLRAIEDIIGRENTYYTTISSNLGLLYENAGISDTSEMLYLQALKIRENVLGEHHPQFVKLQYNLAGLYSYYQPAKAIQLYEEINTKQVDLLHYYYASFDEDTRLSILEDTHWEFEKYFSTVVQNPGKDAQIALLNFHLKTKGMVTEYSLGSRSNVQSIDSAKFQQWKILRDSLAKTYLYAKKDLEEKNIDINQLKHEADQLESEWMGIGSITRDSQNFYSLQKLLAPDELAIDFIRFEWYQGGFWQDSIMYYALVFDNQSEAPHLVRLGTESRLQEILAYANYPLLYDEQQKGLYDLLVKPILGYLEGKSKILLSPTGILHQIPFNGIAIGDGYLTNHFELVLLNSLKEMAVAATGLESVGRALLIGGMNYGQDTSSRRQHFRTIPGTMDEVNLCSELLEQKGWDIRTITGKDANARIILSTLSDFPYDIVHLATHGFALSKKESTMSNTLRASILNASNPLMRTGLACSDANQYWNRAYLGKHNGLINAFQIANLNLTQTHLVILSACESGIGDIQSQEGVFGLPRSFKLAGAENVIYTLWRIDDRVSSIFLEKFYTHIRQGKDIIVAFRNTQVEMSLSYDPFYWAGFVLIQ